MLSTRSLLLDRAGMVSCPRPDLLLLRAGFLLLAPLCRLHTSLQDLRLQLLLQHQRLQGLLMHQRLQGLLLGLVISALSTAIILSTVPFCSTARCYSNWTSAACAFSSANARPFTTAYSTTVDSASVWYHTACQLSKLVC